MDCGPHVLLACYFLWIQNVIPSLRPIVILFFSYATLQFILNWYFMGSRHGRVFDFVLGGMDMISMSLAIYFTGAGNSPLYFLYFIPLIVHAFHRDSVDRDVFWIWRRGFVYGVMILFFFVRDQFDIHVTNLIARLFFHTFRWWGVALSGRSPSLKRKKTRIIDSKLRAWKVKRGYRRC